MFVAFVNSYSHTLQGQESRSATPLMSPLRQEGPGTATASRFAGSAAQHSRHRLRPARNSSVSRSHQALAGKAIDGDLPGGEEPTALGGDQHVTIPAPVIKADVGIHSEIARHIDPVPLDG